jgi:predicted SAM-dependent methyltransferase
MSDQLGICDLPSNLYLHELASSEAPIINGKIDLIYSWSVFEHVRTKYILDILKKFKRNLRIGGLFYLQVNPPYHSARGAHLFGHVSTPWSHLLD